MILRYKEALSARFSDLPRPPPEAAAGAGGVCTVARKTADRRFRLPGHDGVFRFRLPPSGKAVDANSWAGETYFHKHQQFTKLGENAGSDLTYNTDDAASEVIAVESPTESAATAARKAAEVADWGVLPRDPPGR